MAKGKGRKKNKPAQIRYTQEKRWIKNKARKIAKRENVHKRALERKK